jgi:hypothetical protein
MSRSSYIVKFFNFFFLVSHIRFPTSHAAPSSSFKFAPSPCHFKSMTLQLHTALIDNSQMDFVNTTIYYENFRLQIHSVLNVELAL